jgi:GNAT superfamily N-acetyltransferase
MRIQTTYFPEGDPGLPVFKAWCESHGLYDATRGDMGRMRRVYDGRRPTSALSASIAYGEGGRPVGICLCEPQSEKIYPAIVLPMGRSKKPVAQLDWGFIDAGFISFFVEPESRNKGVASALMRSIEESFASRFKAAQGQRLMATALEGAQALVERSRWVCLNPCAPHQGNYPYAISRLASDARMGESIKPALGPEISKQAHGAVESWDPEGLAPLNCSEKIKARRNASKQDGSKAKPSP